MSRNPTPAEMRAIVQTTELRARIELRNKEAARAQLLRIQLLIAQRTVRTSK